MITLTCDHCGIDVARLLRSIDDRWHLDIVVQMRPPRGRTGGVTGPLPSRRRVLTRDEGPLWGASGRRRLTPVCPKCHARPWPDGITWERLDPILTKLLDSGVSSITLSALAGTLRRRS